MARAHNETCAGQFRGAWLKNEKPRGKAATGKRRPKTGQNDCMRFRLRARSPRSSKPTALTASGQARAFEFIANAFRER